MSYVKEKITGKEKILQVGKVHWFVYVPGFICMLITLAALPVSQVFAIFFALFGSYLIIRGYITQYCNELVLTDKRILARTGLISKEVMDLPYDQIYRIRVEMPLWGKALGFGSIKLINRSDETILVENINDPASFRNKVLLTVEKLDTNN